MQQLKSGFSLQGGKYRIIRVLGQGGFGITYLAENLILSKKVAIKEFFPKDYCDRDNTNQLTLGSQNNADTVSKLKQRFLKEAQNIAKHDHPGIIKIHDIFEENNTAYYVMDYIDGENLNEKVMRVGSLSETEAVAYIRKVGSALEYIHSKRMTHFDVKPANIVVRRSDDSPILIDFGLSKQYDAHGDATSTVMQGVSQGYSPIELYNPGSISSFSPQTDIYSLAATLYYLLTGIVPPSAAELACGVGLSYPPYISSYLRNAIIKGMQVKRSSRHGDMTDFLKVFATPNISPNHTRLKCSNATNNNKEEEETTQIINTRIHHKRNNDCLTCKCTWESLDSIINEYGNSSSYHIWQRVLVILALILSVVCGWLTYSLNLNWITIVIFAFLSFPLILSIFWYCTSQIYFSDICSRYKCNVQPWSINAAKCFWDLCWDLYRGFILTLTILGVGFGLIAFFVYVFQ